MSNQTNHVWTLLQENGVVLGEQPARGVSSSPWYVKVLLAFSGWLAAIFITGFIGAAFEFVFKNSGAAGIIGVIMIAGAYSQLRNPANEFLEHLGLATSIAGQALIIYAIFNFAIRNEIVTWLMVAIFQAALATFMPNFVHRVFSALVAAIAFSMMLNEMEIPFVTGGVVMFGASFCWLNEFRYPQQMQKTRAIGYGLVLALIAIKGTTLFGYNSFGEGFWKNQGAWVQPWLGEIIIGAVTVYVVWSLLQRYGQPMKSRLSMITLLATIFVCALSTNVQGITIGMGIVCFGFLGSNRVLLGLGIISLLFYVSSYYYLLDTTLLEKSQSLLMVGLILLFVRWLMLRLVPAHNEVPHA